MYFSLNNIKLIDEEIEIKILYHNNIKWECILADKIYTSSKKDIKFPKICSIDYFFEKEQQLKIEVISQKVKKEVILIIGNILSSNNNSLSVNIEKQFNIKIIANTPETDELCCEFDVSILHTKPIGKELFYVLSNSHGQLISRKQFNRVCKSEEAFPGNNNDWNFSLISLPKTYFCLKEDQDVLIQILEFNSSKTEAEERLRLAFKYSDGLKGIQENIDSKGIKGFVKIHIKEFNLLSFVDYVAKGLNINLITAIDFTGSNGHPMDEASLHYINGQEPTQYEKALRSCGEILAAYDDDQLIPLFGFGGVPPNKMLVEHAFSLAQFQKPDNEIKFKTKFHSKASSRISILKNKDKEKKKSSIVMNFEENEKKIDNFKSVKSEESDHSDDEEVGDIKEKKKESASLFKEESVYGLDGVIEAYKNSINKIVFSGPTNFTPLIDKIRNAIRKEGFDSKKYYILLIITDGQISDLKQTINAIVQAGDLPLSIVIVGVGDDDFSSMRELDGDDFPLTNFNNKVTPRDIAQFVPFSEFSHDMKLLGAEILKEIPYQVESFFQYNNIK